MLFFFFLLLLGVGGELSAPRSAPLAHQKTIYKKRIPTNIWCWSKNLFFSLLLELGQESNTIDLKKKEKMKDKKYKGPIS